MSHSNISIFIPHIGCPCRCSFCNQIHITSENKIPTESDIDLAVSKALESSKFDKKSGQLAFFGGSFTAINEDLMLKYLKVGKKHIDMGNVESIRISTRPDYIDDKVLKTLKKFGVKSIELGAQNMCDSVLEANDRGHLASDVYKASELIKSYGFELGLQMMTGLYKSDEEKDLYTAKEFVKIKPNTVRIYPTVVLKNTKLEQLYKNNEYEPYSAEQAAIYGAKLLKLFYENDINVIRFGLHSIDKNSFVAGAFHPALSEIAQSYIYRELIEDKIKKSGIYKITVKDTELSKVVGQKKSNLEYFKNKKILLDININEFFKKYEIKIERNDG